MRIELSPWQEHPKGSQEERLSKRMRQWYGWQALIRANPKKFKIVRVFNIYGHLISFDLHERVGFAWHDLILLGMPRGYWKRIDKQDDDWNTNEQKLSWRYGL